MDMGGVFRTIFPVTEMDILRKHQMILRKTEFYVNTNNRIMGLIYRIRLMKIQNRYAIHIPINTCAKGLRLMHVGPVLMNGNVTVGENCTFHINTGLVANGPSDQVPELGKGVILGIGAVVVGRTYIANNIIVGANAVVTKDFREPGISIAGVPAKKISNSGSKL